MNTHMNLKKTLVATTASAVLLTGVGFTATPAIASASSQQSAPASGAIPELSSSEWREIEKRARAAGDTQSANAARQMAEGNAQVGGIGGWVKQAVIAVLKYNKDRLPASIRPHANTIVDALERIDGIAEVPLATALMQAGMDPTTARQTADYMVTFAQTFGPI